MSTGEARFSLSNALQAIATTALIGIGGMVFAAKDAIGKIQTDIAVLTSTVDALVKKDIPTRGEVAAQVTSAKLEAMNATELLKQALASHEIWAGKQSEMFEALKAQVAKDDARLTSLEHGK